MDSINAYLLIKISYIQKNNYKEKVKNLKSDKIWYEKILKKI